MTLSELADLAAFAKAQGRVLFASWHSRFNAAVEAAAKALAGRAVRTKTVTWKEDVRGWHPGQTSGGFGALGPAHRAAARVADLGPRRRHRTADRAHPGLQRHPRLRADRSALAVLSNGVRREALVMSFSDVFLILAVVFVGVLFLIPLARRPKPAPAGAGGRH